MDGAIAQQEAGKGVARGIQLAWQVRRSREEIELAGIREQLEIQEVPLILVADTKALFAMNPGEVILVDIAAG